jgi:hypothetical protein
MARTKQVTLQGTIPTAQEMGRWSYEEKLLFVDMLYKFFTKEGSNKLYVTKSSIEAFNAQEGAFYSALARRINTNLPFLFRNKLFQMVRTFGSMLKNNPAFVTDELFEKLHKLPFLDWSIKQFEARQTKMGIELVQACDVDETTQPSRKITVATAEAKYMTAIERSTDLFLKISKSITADEIKSLKTMDKFNALTKMAYILNNARSFKPNATIFQQININSSSREQLEKSLLEYSNQ